VIFLAISSTPAAVRLTTTAPGVEMELLGQPDRLAVAVLEHFRDLHDDLQIDTQYTRRSKTGGPLGALAAPGERGSGVGLRNALRVLACPG